MDPSDTLIMIFEQLDICVKCMMNEGKQDLMAKYCFTIGSIHDCMQIEDESQFLVVILKDLLVLVEKLEGKPKKAAIAADIMYVVG